MSDVVLGMKNRPKLCVCSSIVGILFGLHHICVASYISLLNLTLQGAADRVLIYLTLYISECLKKLQKVYTQTPFVCGYNVWSTVSTASTITELGYSEPM